jgi:uncharacterized protein
MSSLPRIPRRVCAAAVGLAAALAAGSAATAAPLPPPSESQPPVAEEPTMSHASGHQNRLAGESSPYLLLHKDNPVDWYPWGEEALERARREGKPIFLSVGYSTCYWCHVMERESFSDPAVAALMNASFVCIKVDREERPDLDEIYMAATQILTGQGGWPNSVFLTPGLKPFYAGTYFPPEDRHGLPGFSSLLRTLAAAWAERREEVDHHADEVAERMRKLLEERRAPADGPPAEGVVRDALRGLSARFDRRWGGFGPAPKFPSPANLFLLLELAPDEPRAAEMLHATLDQMARGGIYDQLGGGFHRYSTDGEWKVPHFEKMLYDNGLLLEVYAREFARGGDPEMARVARETAEFLRREMTSPEGALWSAIDAETDGHEGAYYVWSPAELEAALGTEDFAFAAPLLGFSGAPFFEGSEYVLHLPERLDAVAAERKMTREALLGELASPRAKLLAARETRKRPLTDDKVLADWNGLAISGLAVAGRLLGEPELVHRAEAAADFALSRLRPAGDGGERRLFHSWRGGRAKVPAFLADYAYLTRGLLALDEATGDPRWLAAAAELTDEQITRLRTPQGAFYEAAAAPDLLFRSQDVFDGATPSPNAVAVLNLLALARRTGEAKWRREAEAALAATGPQVERFPDGARMMAVAVHRYHQTAATGGTVAEAAPAAASRGTGAAEEADAGSKGPGAERPAAPSAALDAEARRAVELHATFAPAGADGWRAFRLTLAVAPGWHVNANPASAEFLVPTRVETRGATLRALRYPPAKKIKPSYAEEAVAVWEGTVEVTGELRPEGDAESAALAVTYQACDADRCLRPLTREIAAE